MTIGPKFDEGEVEEVEAVLIDSEGGGGFGGDGAEDTGSDSWAAATARDDGFCCGGREFLWGSADMVVDSQEVEESVEFVFYGGGSGSWDILVWVSAGGMFDCFKVTEGLMMECRFFVRIELD